MQDNQKPLIIGRIGGVYGVRGWLKLESFTRPKENIFTYSPLLIKIDGSWQTLNVEEFQQRGSGRLLVKVAGVDSPEDARKYTRCELAVVQEQLLSLANGEYYWHELIGLEVFNQDNVSLGKINEILETGANDVLVIKTAGQKKVKTLIPLLMDIYIKRVDLIAKTMKVEWQLED